MAVCRKAVRDFRREYPTLCDETAKDGAPDLLPGLEVFEDLLDAVGGPGQVFFFDDEGWGEADDVVVCLFGKDAFAHEGFADGAGRGG